MGNVPVGLNIVEYMDGRLMTEKGERFRESNCRKELMK